MKKKYLFMSSFFVIGTIFTLLFFWSYQAYDEEIQEVRTEKETSRTVDTVKELRTNTSMKYVREIYDGTTGVVTNEDGTMPAELAGLTREELEASLSEYNQAIVEKGTTDGPDHKELISFSRDRIVIRETYSGAEEEEGFFLKAVDGEVTIFHNDQVTPYENTGIQVDVLPEDERQKLTEGYFVADERELYSILENLSS